MNFEIEYIEKLANLADEKQLTEITVEDGDKAIIIKRGLNSAAAIAPQIIQQAPQVSLQTQDTEIKATSASDKKEESKGTAIVSPMVGAFYASPSPGAKPFVKVGDTVAAGQVVCIVEAMKLMNEIESEVSGKITQICVEDGQSVEYGQVLMYVE